MTVTRKKLQFEIEIDIKKKLLEHITTNKKIQKDIIKSLNKNYLPDLSFTEKIFSIKNKYFYNYKSKILTILGLHFSILVNNLEKNDD